MIDENAAFIAFADGVCDVVWGGECGWEDTGLKELLAALRKTKHDSAEQIEHLNEINVVLGGHCVSQEDRPRTLKWWSDTIQRFQRTVDRYQQEQDEINVALGGHCTSQGDRLGTLKAWSDTIQTNASEIDQIAEWKRTADVREQQGYSRGLDQRGKEIERLVEQKRLMCQKLADKDQKIEQLKTDLQRRSDDVSWLKQAISEATGLLAQAMGKTE